MNGDEFDFDALRDPLAPVPGARERAAVDERARQLHAHTRRSRLAMSSISILAVVAIVAGVVASQRDTGPQIQVEGPSSTEPSSIGNRFVPPTTTENGIVTVPVTLPDGETTTLTYPEGLRIAQLGFAGDIGVNWPVATGDPHCCSRVVSITYDTIEHVYGKNATPITTYPGVNGESVPFFHSTTNAALDYLVFQFGPWLVQVYDVEHSGDHEIRMTDNQRATWARSLSGTVDDNGYLVLHAAAPLSIDNGFDGGFGAGGGNSVELASHLYCGQPESDSSAHRRSTSGGLPAVSWCVGDLHVSASGSTTFVDLADRELAVSALTPAPAPGTTTTTTATPTSINGPALSASFISPEHGWVLLKNGDVVETTDAGVTWKTLGSVGTVPYGDTNLSPQIRFADATTGFLHSDSAFYETVDGGVTWTTIATPFEALSDVAIAHGVVYDVAYDARAGGFALWSSPVDRLNWRKDPLSLPFGAGPEPLEQLLLSGSNGWVLNRDRTVLGGARLTPAGTWEAWTPPCLDVNGPAFFTASSATDLVASCHEHEWGGGPVASAIYFSHDAGKTFQRHEAPASGEVASPNPTTVVVDTEGTLRRTTDEGATWTEVASVPDAGRTVDFGFTTPMQGFVIFDNGAMLMTHDAGASWQKVTLP